VLPAQASGAGRASGRPDTSISEDLFYETVHHETLWQTASYVVDVCRCFDFRWDWKIKKILVGSKGTHLG
jgi:hypothetical protein